MNQTNTQAPATDAVASGALLACDFQQQFARRVYDECEPVINNACRRDVEFLVMLLLQKRSVDGYQNRRWDADAHLFFEMQIQDLLKQMSNANVTAERRGNSGH